MKRKRDNFPRGKNKLTEVQREREAWQGGVMLSLLRDLLCDQVSDEDTQGNLETGSQVMDPELMGRTRLNLFRRPK